MRIKKSLDSLTLKRAAQQLEMASMFMEMQSWEYIPEEQKRELLVSTKLFIENALSRLVEVEGE